MSTESAESTEEISDIDLSEASFKTSLYEGSGEEIPESEYLLLSLDIRKEVNRIPKAILSFLKSGNITENDRISQKPYFIPGKQIEVRLSYENDQQDRTVFKGVVIKNSISIRLRQSKFTIELRDIAVGLTRPRKSAVFVKKSDDEIIQKIVDDANIEGLEYEKNDDPQKYDQVVQHYCSDWDFIVSRAEARGRLVVANDSKLSVRKVDLNPDKKENKHKLELGENAIYDLEFSANLGQLGVAAKANKSFAWDFNTQEPTSQEARDFELKQGNKESEEDRMGFRPDQLSSFAPLEKEELQEWVTGHLMRHRLAEIQGRMEVLGSAKYNLLDVVEINGLGERYNGKALITGICHRADINGWNTDLQFGLSARSFSQEQDILDAPAAGLLPGVNGLHIGIVKKFEMHSEDKDPRVQVRLPGLDTSDEETEDTSDKKTESLVWARMAVPGAGKERGWSFYPEPGDEVVVGFFNDDPRQPVILGSLFSPKKMPHSEVLEGNKAKNSMKALVSKTGSMVGFIDDAEDKGSIVIETKDHAKILIDDSEGMLTIFDQNKNEITMSENGISLKTPKNFTLQASGTVEIKGKKVNIN